MTLSREALADLRRKYEELLRLRLEDAAAPAGHDPAREMALVADRFPGSLREIDELSLEAIRARIGELVVAEKDLSRTRPWMVATHHFHVLARGALAAKRWLAGRKEVDEEVVRAFERDARSLRYAEEAALWTADLASLARPPRGRLMVLVYARVARHMAISAAEVRLLVFGAGRRRRR